MQVMLLDLILQFTHTCGVYILKVLKFLIANKYQNASRSTLEVEDVYVPYMYNVRKSIHIILHEPNTHYFIITIAKEVKLLIRLSDKRKTQNFVMGLVWNLMVW